MRLSTMIVLFAVVLLLMLVSNRPEIWSRFVPNWDESDTAQATKTSQSADSAARRNQSAPPAAASRSPSQQSPLLMGGLLVVAVAYFAWRIARIGRAVSRRVETNRDLRMKSRATWANRPRPTPLEAGQPTPSLPQPAPDSVHSDVDHLDPAEPNPENAGG